MRVVSSGYFCQEHSINVAVAHLLETWTIPWAALGRLMFLSCCNIWLLWACVGWNPSSHLLYGLENDTRAGWKFHIHTTTRIEPIWLFTWVPLMWPHAAGLCWLEPVWVCWIRQHNTSVSPGGIRHKEHPTGQLYSEGGAAVYIASRLFHIVQCFKFTMLCIIIATSVLHLRGM